ncbi:trypsin-like serine peptidase [Streptomyces sp. NPDC059582]|uniref:trypsin-like serine peptidase n=1 Tax=Streptomyces sp. NPDC059582 TaxID=3346875 RepID=UPI00369DE8CA
MKRTLGILGPRRHGLLGALVLLAAASASTAAADDGTGPLGVTAVVTATAPAARVGALFPAGRAVGLAGGHFCTASVVHSPHRDLIVTAAHCLAGKSGTFVFVPGYRDGEAPYGVWTVRRRFLPDRWADGRVDGRVEERTDGREDGRLEDSDVAFAVVEPQGGGGDEGAEGAVGEKGVEDVVGANRFAAGVATGATAVTVTGYPDAREVPVSCTDKPTTLGFRQQRVDCPDFSGGTSGSPWVNGDRQLVGVLGGHERGGNTADISYSVVFGSEARELYEDAVRGF